MSRTLPLHELHRQRGATLGAQAGWEVPLHYGDPAAEHRAVRHAAGLLDRSHCGRVEVIGRDRASFLHGMLTNDVKALTPGQGCAAALLDNHGKVQALLGVYALADRLLLLLPPGLVDRTLVLLDKFLISERVEFQNITESTGALSIQGPGSVRILSRLAGETMEPIAGRVVEHGIDGTTVRLIGVSETGEEGVQLWAPREHLGKIWSRLWEHGGEELTPVGELALNSLRVEAGLPWCPEDLNEETLFMEAEAQLASYVSFTKGCYIGQEVVARIKYRGRVNRRLTGLLISGGATVSPGAVVVRDGKEVGAVTSSATSPDLGPIALAMIRREVVEGDHVELSAKDQVVRASVSALPFPRRSTDTP